MKTIWAGLVLGFSPLLVAGQTTQPGDDAAKLYLQAANLVQKNAAINVQCPAASNNTWPHEYPPYPDDWQDMESFDFDSNTEARELAHRARTMDYARWPALGAPYHGSSYLNDCRGLANELSDAALYQMTQKDYGAAVETLRDEWHFADLLENRSDKKIICLLVRIGIRALALDRLQIVMANAVLTKDPRNLRDIQVSVVRDLIKQLTTEPLDSAKMIEYLKAEKVSDNSVTHTTIDRLTNTARKIDTDCGLAAVALACDLYRFDHGAWPVSLEGVREEIAKLPVDPGGDGKQTLGYVLIKNGLPNGLDRPLVYSRLASKDGLFFVTSEPAYSYYHGDGSHVSIKDQKEGGQFRDVAGWVPAEGNGHEPATQALH